MEPSHEHLDPVSRNVLLASVYGFCCHSNTDDVRGTFKDLTGSFSNHDPWKHKNQNNLACAYFPNGSGKIKHQLGHSLRLFNIPLRNT